MAQRRIPAKRSQAYTRWSLGEVAPGHVLRAETPRGERRAPAPEPAAEPWRRESLEDQLVANIRAGRFAAGVSARELEAIVRDAAREGRDEGYAEGFARGQQEGHAEGRADGLQAGRAIVEDAAQRLASLVDALREPLSAQDEALRAALLELVLRIARGVVRAELKIRPESVARVVEEALAALPLGAAHVRVHVCPADLALLEEVAAQRAWALESDASLEPGDCRVESRDTLIDYRVEARLGALVEQLRGGGA